jgi:hypothetical protein
VRSRRAADISQADKKYLLFHNALKFDVFANITLFRRVAKFAQNDAMEYFLNVTMLRKIFEYDTVSFL